MPLNKRFDAENRIIRPNDRLLDPQAKFARHCRSRRVRSYHPPGGQRLPHARKAHPVRPLSFTLDMQDIKTALGRYGKAERVYKSIQSGRREISWMNDTFGQYRPYDGVVLRLPLLVHSPGA